MDNFIFHALEGIKYLHRPVSIMLPTLSRTITITFLAVHLFLEFQSTNTLHVPVQKQTATKTEYILEESSTNAWNIQNTELYKLCIYVHMVSYIKGGIQAKGMWKQDTEANIWAQEGWEWGVEKVPQWGTS